MIFPLLPKLVDTLTQLLPNIKGKLVRVKFSLYVYILACCACYFLVYIIAGYDWSIKAGLWKKTGCA